MVIYVVELDEFVMVAGFLIEIVEITSTSGDFE